MSKIIIKNETDINDLESLSLIKRVVNMGKICNNNTQYCYVACFIINDKQVIVDAGKHKSGTYTFRIYYNVDNRSK